MDTKFVTAVWDKTIGAAWCRGFAKRTLLKTARRAGIKTSKEPSGKRNKYNIVTATPPMMRRLTGSTLTSADTLTADAAPQQQLTMFDDDLSGLYVSVYVCLSVFYHFIYLLVYVCLSACLSAYLSLDYIFWLFCHIFHTIVRHCALTLLVGLLTCKNHPRYGV